MFINKPTRIMCSCSEKKKAWANRIFFLGLENTHTHHIIADHHSKEDGYKEELIILKDNLDNQVQKQ